MNKASNNPFPRSLDSDPAEVLVSNLLADVVASKNAPDLSDRIRARLDPISRNDPRNASRSASLFLETDYDAAVATAQFEIQNGFASNPSKASRKALVPGQTTASTAHWVNRFVIVISGLAATLVIGLLISNAFWKIGADSSSELTKDSPIEDKTSIADNRSDSIERTAIEPIAKDSSSALVKQEYAPKSNSTESKSTSASDALVSDQSEISSSQKSNADANSPTEKAVDEKSSIASTEKPVPLSSDSRGQILPKSNTLVNSLSDAEMVGIIDSQFTHLWKRFGLVALQNVRDEEWLDRSAMAIVGRVPTAAEKEAYRASKRDDRDVEFVNKLIDSGEFASHWADMLAEFYLGYRVIGVRRQPGNQRQFVRWLADALSKQVFIGQIEQELVGDISDDRTLVRSDASSFWIAETLDRSAIEYQESGSELLKKYTNSKHAGRIGMARQLMRISGNATMACTQCHTLDSLQSPTTDLLSVVPNSNNTGMDVFWQVPASLSGWSFLRKGENERQVIQEKATDFFFDDAQGRLKVATAGLPTLDRSSASKPSLNEWIKSSVEPRRSHVDLVWSKVFGQSLVPVFGLSEEEGKDERRDLRDLLADQLQSGQRDLGTLLRWLVLSRPFRVDGQILDTPWYLRSSELQMAESQRHMRLFASSSIPKPAAKDYGKLSMNRVTAWIESKRSFDSTTQALAQRTDNNLSPKASTIPKPNYSEDQIRFLNAVARPYANVSKLADRLASSPMKWAQLVDHAYLVSDTRFPTKLERDEANKLFEAAGRERTKALLALIQARLGTY